MESVRKSSRWNRGTTPSQGKVPPPTPVPAFGITKSEPTKLRGSDHMILPAFASAFCKAVCPLNRGPASSTATVNPCAAIRSATSAPVAPAPTMSTSNVRVKSRENESRIIRTRYPNAESRTRTRIGGADRRELRQIEGSRRASRGAGQVDHVIDAATKRVTQSTYPPWRLEGKGVCRPAATKCRHLIVY